MRRLWRMMGAVLVGALVLAGCGGGDDDTTEGTDAVAADDPGTEDTGEEGADDAEQAGDDVEEVTMRYQSWRHADPGPVQELHGERWVERLQETHPHITVVADPVPHGERGDAVLNEILAGNPPDLVALTADQVPVFAEYMRPLDDFFDQEGQDFLDQFAPATLDMVEWEGSLYAIPNDLGPLDGMYYNEELLAEAGVDPEEALSSWENFAEAAQAVDALGDDIYGKVMLGENSGRVRDFFPWMTMNGADMWEEEHVVDDLCSPEATEAYVYRAGLYTDLGVATNPVDTDWQTGHDLFVTGRAGFLRNGPWMKDIFLDTDPDFDQIMGVGRIPPPEVGGESVAALDGLMLMIPADAPNPEAAWEFAKVAASVESQEELVLEAGFFPVNTQAAEHPDVAGDEFLSFWAELIEDAGRPVLKSQNTEEILQIFWDNWQAASIGQIDLEESLERTCEEIRNALG